MKYHHGDLANALVREARILVEEHGAEAFSLREAASRCGVAVSSAYKHYGSKGELLVALAELGFGELADLIDRRVRRATRGLAGVKEAEARLVEMGRTYILFAIEHPHLFRLMYGRHEGAVEDRAQLRSAQARRVSKALVGGVRDVLEAYGHPGADVDASRVIAWAGVHGFSMMVLDGLWPVASKRALDAMIAELGQSVLRALR
jgi:AcrR family transcriptional regulator